VKREALLYDKKSNYDVQCRICRRQCTISSGEKGWCLTRLNEKGTLYSLLYGNVSSLSVNPIEKKPVYHFLPGSKWLSVGSWGCNFRCPGCQNWEVAHRKSKDIGGTYYQTPMEQVTLAREQNCAGISWTFNEPALWFEFTLDTARKAKENNLYTNYVTNGNLSENALFKIIPFLDIYRVDIKGFSNEVYGEVANIGGFKGILAGAEMVAGKGIHVEVVTNIIPGYNDGEEQLWGIADWIKNYLGEETPWHVTRFFPHYRLSHLKPTEISTLENARSIGFAQGLKYVYVGNVPDHEGENTVCPECGSLLIRRQFLDIRENRLVNGHCPDCNLTIPGTFQ
jgi:pyruvate formate lyase activating enzyme